jgi:hypothetical protein
MDYWLECIAEALSEAGVTATDVQIKEIAGFVEGAHENYGMAFYQPENPLIGELAETKRKLQVETQKVHCKECNGSGQIGINGPYHSSVSQCWKCNGEGKVSP